MTGLKSYQVKYRISTGQITVTRRGRHLYAEADAASRLIRQEQITALTKELQRLRVLWKMLEHTAVGVEGAAPRAWDAARKWLKEQQKKQRTPAEVYAMIAAAPAIQGRCQQESALLSRAQTLLDQLGSQVPWRTEPLEGQQDGPR